MDKPGNIPENNSLEIVVADQLDDQMEPWETIPAEVRIQFCFQIIYFSFKF